MAIGLSNGGKVTAEAVVVASFQELEALSDDQVCFDMDWMFFIIKF